MRNNKTTLDNAIEFHGHLGPWLVLGLLIGNIALKKLKSKKYFGLKVAVWGVNKKPKSCLIDGLQLSTGATYGKGNIKKIKSDKFKVIVSNLRSNKKIKITLNENFMEEINSLKLHKDSELLAKRLFRIRPSKIFDLQP